MCFGTVSRIPHKSVKHTSDLKYYWQYPELDQLVCPKLDLLKQMNAAGTLKERSTCTTTRSELCFNSARSRAWSVGQSAQFFKKWRKNNVQNKQLNLYQEE